jgi:hypothetical protein
LLNRQVARFCSPQNLIHDVASPPE